MKKKRKLSIKKVSILAVSIAMILIAVTSFLKTEQYHKSLDYKLKKIGYNKEEVAVLKKESEKEKWTQTTWNQIQKMKYTAILPKIVQEKYFLLKNLERYLAYQTQNPKMELNKVITMVNVGRDSDFYEGTSKTDISKGLSMLVNKYHYLEKTYKPKDIASMNLQYAYDDNSATREVYEAFVEMCDEAKESKGYTLIANSSYRDYEWQDSLYKNYTVQSGQTYADSVAARPGFSEHQTGLALDITAYGKSFDDFADAEEYKWLSMHAHEYGFILRYPKEKEDITGYDYEPWHYRYVGKDLAKKIYQSGLTFDEYYAYYIEK